jgi:hypothetical protein
MGTFTIQAPNGKSYTVEGDNADGALTALKKHLGEGSTDSAPDKYHQAAIDDIAAAKTAGADEGAGFTRRLAHGATLGADNTILAAMQTPLEMIKRGTASPAEGYNYAKAREDQIMEDARKNTGSLGTGAELLGGGVAGGGLAQGGVTAARALAPEAGMVPRALAAAADGIGLGGVSGAMEGNGLAERATNAAKGAAFGGALGAAAPFGFAALKAVASPVINNLAARFNPQRFAEGQVARAVQESGITPNQISLDTIQAANEGQGGYTVADAMDNSGQRMLSTVARAPGEGRTAVVDALEGRQADQGRRVASTLAEGFDSPRTAAQARDAMTTARNDAANTEYGSVRAGSNPVDVVGTVNHIDRVIGTGPGQQLQAPNDGIEATLRGFRERLARVNPDDFEAVQRIRGEMSDAAQNAAQNGYGNRARLIRGALGQLDTAMEAASPGFRQANANFRQSSQNIEAIDAGRTAATRGRTEDTIPAFQALPPEGQAAFRTGYVDPLIEQTQGAAFGVNKARPFTSDAFQQEAAAIAPRNEMMQRRLDREMTMFETRNAALGGSKTADNLADAASMSVSPEIVGMVGHILHGNIGGAVRTALHAGANAFSGSTPAVRQAVADVLLQRGANMNPAALERMVNQVMARMERVQATARALGQATRAGADVTASEKVATRR